MCKRELGGGMEWLGSGISSFRAMSSHSLEPEPEI